MVITIDGPVAAGKTSTARGLAAQLGCPLLDTGAIYRCVALEAMKRREDWSDETGVTRVAGQIEIDFQRQDGVHRIFLDDTEVTEAIRQPQISRGASIVSALPSVRTALLELQRQQATKGDLIAEGRDTGTVIFPRADCKFFLTARPEIRAHRRLLQLQSQGIDTGFREVLAELEERDHRDSTRAVAPLQPASDATTIDSSDMNAEEVIAEMRRLLSAGHVTSGS